MYCVKRLLVFVLCSCDVQWQPNSLHPSSNTPPVGKQIAYFPINGAGAGPTTPAGRAQFTDLPVS